MRASACLLALAVGVPIANAEEIRVNPTPQRNPPVVARADEPTTSWVAIAASPNRRVFKVGTLNNEEAARARAKSECEQATGRTCSAMSVPFNWTITVVNCRDSDRRASYLGGSALGYAEQIANDKAQRGGFSPDTCEAIYTY